MPNLTINYHRNTIHDIICPAPLRRSIGMAPYLLYNSSKKAEHLTKKKNLRWSTKFPWIVRHDLKCHLVIYNNTFICFVKMNLIKIIAKMLNLFVKSLSFGVLLSCPILGLLQLLNFSSAYVPASTPPPS